MASLSRDDVEHVALLARLGLDEEEIGRLQVQMNHILEQHARLAGLDTDAIAPTAQAIEVENILRDDTLGPSLPASAVLDNAPETRDGRIVVPAIIGGD
jgi:aspartyl-tRNA(Asn)/glutamyl-tRNA(Gln) amidotransferase subunit C